MIYEKGLKNQQTLFLVVVIFTLAPLELFAAMLWPSIFS